MRATSSGRKRHQRRTCCHLSNWSATETNEGEIPFKPSWRYPSGFHRGWPAVVDLASLKTVHDLGGDPALINPEVPVDLVIDHSVQVDNFGSPQALNANMKMEFLRNQERYQFLSWAQKAFDNYGLCRPLPVLSIKSILSIWRQSSRKKK